MVFPYYFVKVFAQCVRGFLLKPRSSVKLITSAKWYQNLRHCLSIEILAILQAKRQWILTFVRGKQGKGTCIFLASRHKNHKQMLSQLTILR